MPRSGGSRACGLRIVTGLHGNRNSNSELIQFCLLRFGFLVEILRRQAAGPALCSPFMVERPPYDGNLLLLIDEALSIPTHPH